ncbi:hypothetical protein ACIHDR_10825 [Nocardia sp. NPDC052278]
MSWLVAVYHSVVHGAAAAGHLADSDATVLITTTPLAVYPPPN